MDSSAIYWLLSLRLYLDYWAWDSTEALMRLRLYWDSTETESETLLRLYWLVRLYWDWNSTDALLTLYWCSSEAPLRLLRFCSDWLLRLYWGWDCIETLLRLYSDISETILRLWLYRDSTEAETLMSLYRDSTETLLMLRLYCSPQLILLITLGPSRARVSPGRRWIPRDAELLVVAGWCKRV